MSKQVILYLAANPLGTPRLQLGEEEHAIRDALSKSTGRDCFTLEPRFAAQPLDLITELRRLRPIIVQFSGHGRPGSLFFQAMDGLTHEVSGQALASALEAVGDSVRVVVLNACFTDEIAKVLPASVDYVVGMSGVLEDNDAVAFSVGFYGDLGEGRSVEEAFKSGKAAAALISQANADRARIYARARPGPPLVLADLKSPPLEPPRSIRQPSAFRGTTLGSEIVELLQRVPGASDYAERTRMLPALTLVDGKPLQLERNERSPRVDFELIIAQLENFGLPLLEQMLYHVALGAPSLAESLKNTARAVRTYIDGRRPEPLESLESLDSSDGLRLQFSDQQWNGFLRLDHMFEGNNTSPALRWSGVPSRTESFVIVMEDLDRGEDDPRYFWLQHSIPSNVRELPRNAGAVGGALLGVGRPGRTDAERTNLPGYRGPNPTTLPHRYELRLYALARADIPDGQISSSAQLLSWIEDRKCILAQSSLVVHAKTPISNRDFLFKLHPLLGGIFGSSWQVVCAMFMALALVLLMLPAWMLGIDDLPPAGWTTQGGVYPGAVPLDNRGFFHQPNWPPIYVLAVPVFFACVAGFAKWIRGAVQRIARCPGGVITAPPEYPFVLFVQTEISRSARKVLYLAALAGLLVGLIDTAPLVLAFYTQKFDAIRPYWAIAHLHAKHIEQTRVIVFNIIAYIFEGCFVFLFAFITLKFLTFLRVLSSTIRGRYRERGFIFTPFWHDPAHCLGLSPVGVPYTAFIALATAVAGFAFLHRLQLLSEVGSGWSGYVQDLKTLLAGDWSVLVPLLRWSSITTGMFAMLVTLTIPAGVIAYFPLYQIRRLIQREIEDENDVYQKKKELATTDEQRAELAERHRILKSTNVWPNGDATAYLSMSIWVSLFAAAIYPPLLALGVAWLVLHSGLLLKRKLFPRFAVDD